MSGITEGLVEEACLDYFRGAGYETQHGPDIGPGGIVQERSNWGQVILLGRLESAIRSINPTLPPDAVRSVVNTALRAESQNALTENLRVHTLLTRGVAVEYRAKDGATRHTLAWLVDFDHPTVNDWLVVNQFSVIEDGHTRRPDVVVFLNGLPVALLELKNAGSEQATIKGAWNQIQTYRSEIGSIFTPNAVCIASDGVNAVMGAFSSGFEHYAPWKTVDGREVVTGLPGLEVLVRGVFEPTRFLDLVRSFIVFSDEPSGLVKRVARYHQFWAVNVAVERTIEASGPTGDRRGGVVWHTQGSGKSFEMLCYAAKIMREPAMGNPTLVLITDRNDLDDQLWLDRRGWLGVPLASSCLIPTIAPGEQIGHRQSHGLDDRLRAAAGVASQQHSPVIARGHRQARTAILVTGAPRAPALARAADSIKPVEQDSHRVGHRAWAGRGRRGHPSRLTPATYASRSPGRTRTARPMRTERSWPIVGEHERCREFATKSAEASGVSGS